MSLTDSPLTFTAGTQYWGFRFQSCPIPAGATITSAVLTLYVTSTTYDDPGGLIIYGEDTADAATFTTGASNISGRALTTASVTWTGTNIGDADRNSPDLTSILDEVINTGGTGYAAGNDIALILDATGSTVFRVRSYDGFTDTCARLTVEYTAGGQPMAARGRQVPGMRTPHGQQGW